MGVVGTNRFFPHLRVDPRALCLLDTPGGRQGGGTLVV